MPALSFFVGLVGNMISVLVFASPIGTFRGIVRRKSIENYKATPYITTILSTSLWTFYGLLKKDGLLIYTINGAGTVFQIIYVTLFLVYAPKDIRKSMMKLVALLNIGMFGVVVAVALFALHGNLRLLLVGIVCATLTIGMYAAPLTVMRTVIKTKSVEFMPFFLSFFLFINATVWTIYAVLIKDIFVGVPNALGFFLGSAQLILYAIYNKNKNVKSTSEVGDVEKESIYLVTKAGDLEMQLGYPTTEMISKTSLYKDLSLPKMTNAILPSEYGMKKIIKAMSLSSYELQAIVLGAKEDADSNKKDDCAEHKTF